MNSVSSKQPRPSAKCTTPSHGHFFTHVCCLKIRSRGAPRGAEREAEHRNKAPHITQETLNVQKRPTMRGDSSEYHWSLVSFRVRLAQIHIHISCAYEPLTPLSPHSGHFCHDAEHVSSHRLGQHHNAKWHTATGARAASSDASLGRNIRFVQRSLRL